MTRHDLKRFRDAESGDLVRAWIRRIEAGETPRRAARYLGQSPTVMRGIAALEPTWAEALRVAIARQVAE